MTKFFIKNNFSSDIYILSLFDKKMAAALVGLIGATAIAVDAAIAGGLISASCLVTSAAEQGVAGIMRDVANGEKGVGNVFKAVQMKFLNLYGEDTKRWKTFNDDNFDAETFKKKKRTQRIKAGEFYEHKSFGCATNRFVIVLCPDGTAKYKRCWDRTHYEIGPPTISFDSKIGRLFIGLFSLCVLYFIVNQVLGLGQANK
jgi:hypothetical protein